MKKITLQVNGRKMIFSEEELIAICEKHFSDKTSKTKAQTTKGVQTKDEETKPTKTKEKDKYFDVVASSIDQSLFQEEKADAQQEWTRQFILEAFAEIDKHPERYAKPFRVMIPQKTWRAKRVGELKKLAKELGDHIANWVEWALSLAQRISNGETWEAICNDPDTEEWYRLVEWKDGLCRLVGCSVNFSFDDPASYVSCGHYEDNCNLDVAVPAIVRYEQDCPMLDRIAS